MKRRYAIFDIETAFGLYYSFANNMYEASLSKEHTPIRLLCISIKELGKRPKNLASIDYRTYRDFVQAVRDELSLYDVLIGHNAKKFDLRQMNVFFAECGLSGLKQFPKNLIDTKLEAKAAWNLPSYSLKFLLSHFQLGAKIETGGEELWYDCMKFNDDGTPKHPEQWKKMIRYCNGDTVGTEALFEFMRGLGFIRRIPYTQCYVPGQPCPVCGVSFSMIQSRGEKERKEGVVREFYCKGHKQRLLTDVIRPWEL